jgi:hypothetical protein
MTPQLIGIIFGFLAFFGTAVIWHMAYTKAKEKMNGRFEELREAARSLAYMNERYRKQITDMNHACARNKRRAKKYRAQLDEWHRQYPETKKTQAMVHR